MAGLAEVANDLPIILPLYPRGQATLAGLGLIDVPGVRVVGVDPERIAAAASRALAAPPEGHVPPLWDGLAGNRIAAVLAAD